MAQVILTSSLFLLREGMKHILSTQRDIHVAGVFSCVADLCARTTHHPEEIIVFAEPIFDLTKETLSRLSRQCPSIRTIIIAPAKAIRSRFQDIKQGVRGILAAENIASGFPDAIRMVHAGKAYVSVELLDLISQQVQLGNAPAYASLSERELEIFAYIAAGKRNQTIGSELAISCKTVSTHKMRLMDKLGVHSVPELVQYALQTGLIDIACDAGTDDDRPQQKSR
ncbi:MAG: LuxR C-terminal-related transcriptional regulator [Burkholderiaceae bacterium]